MAKPFQLTLNPKAESPKLKPGWHKRALVSERRYKQTTAPQHGNPAADEKAISYALWLAERDGIAITSERSFPKVDWAFCQSGRRPYAVRWMTTEKEYRPKTRGMAQPVIEPLLKIELPNWDYVPPEVVEIQF